MATEDHRHQPVRDDEQDYPSEGDWEYLVHDCRTPSLAEITGQAAAVGTIWKCGNCSNRWKLINHTKQGGLTGLSGNSALVWRRITPTKEEEGEQQK